MTEIIATAGGVSGEDCYPSVAFKAVGDSVAGRIVGIENYQVTEFGSNPPVPKFYPKSGDPVMGIRITLETRPGDASSRVTLWAQGKKLMLSIAKAFRESGANDVTVGDDLAVTFTGYDGAAKTYHAAYSVA